MDEVRHFNIDRINLYASLLNQGHRMFAYDLTLKGKTIKSYTTDIVNSDTETSTAEKIGRPDVPMSSMA